MSHQFLFYAPALVASDTTVDIDEEEHHHLTRVLRLRTGDVTCVTNGKGLIVAARILDIGKSSTRFSVESTVSDTKRENEMCLALALIKKDRFEQAFEQCVELGITQCRPFVAEKSKLKDYTGQFLDRLRRIGASAMKQSFQAILPRVYDPVVFSDLLPMLGDYDTMIVGDQSAAAGGRPTGSVIVIAGPEAGLTSGEYDLLAGAGATLVSTSDHRLRAETAAVTLVASHKPRD